MRVFGHEIRLQIDGSIATAGSFCLFCGNGPGGLPTVTGTPPAWAEASDRNSGTIIAAMIAANRPRLSDIAHPTSR